MSEPNDSLLYYLGADGNPSSGSIGGAIDTGTPIDEADANNLHSNLPILGTEKVYRGIAYRKNEWTGDITNPKMVLRTGGLVPTAGGLIRAVSSSASDTGDLWITFLSAAATYEETLTMDGTTSVYTTDNADSGSYWVAEYVDGNPVGNITFYDSADVVIGVMNGSSGEFPNDQAGTLFTVAVATAFDTTLSAADRETSPTGIGSFSGATYFEDYGTDNSIALSGDWMSGTAFGYCVKCTIPADLKKPPSNSLVVDVDVIGDPVA